MPQPRVATKILELRGSLKKRPQRAAKRANEPVPTGKLSPPEWLDAATQAAWDEFLGYCHPGLLTAADAPYFLYVTRLWMRVRDNKSLDHKLGLRFEAAIAKLGMSPADRSRVSVPKQPGPPDPEDEFARKVDEFRRT